MVVGASDAGADEPSTSIDLLAPCAGASDVFFVDTLDPISGPAARATYTTGDTTFDAAVPPLLRITVMPTLHSPSILGLELLGDGDAPVVPAPGTYRTGTSGLEVSLYLEEVSAPFDEGTVTIEDVQVDPGDGGPDCLHSLLLAYDLLNSAAQTARGCLRYVE